MNTQNEHDVVFMIKFWEDMKKKTFDLRIHLLSYLSHDNQQKIENNINKCHQIYEQIEKLQKEIELMSTSKSNMLNK